MAEVRPNWLGSEVGYVPKTVTVTKSSGTTVLVDGRETLLSGTLITDPVLGKGLLVNDADVHDGSRVASMMIRGTYIDSKLPVSVSASAADLAEQGLYAIAYPETNYQY